MTRTIYTHGRKAGMPETLATQALQFLAQHPTGAVLTVAGTAVEEDALWYYIERLLPPGSDMVYVPPRMLVRTDPPAAAVRALSVTPEELQGAVNQNPTLFIMHDAANLHPDDFEAVLQVASHPNFRVVVASRPYSEAPSLDLFAQLTYDPEWEHIEWRLDPPEPPRYLPEPDPLPVEPEPEPEPDPNETENPADVDG